MWQDHAHADYCWSGKTHRGRYFHWWAGSHPSTAAGEKNCHGVPELCPLPSPDRFQKYRLSAQSSGCPEGSSSTEGGMGRGDVRYRASLAAQTAPTIGRRTSAIRLGTRTVW